MKTTLHRGETVGVGKIGSRLVVSHGREAPSHEDWARVCDIISEYHSTVRGQLVLSLGGAPNATQRKKVLSVLPKGYIAPPVAALTDQVMARGVITVMNWFLNDSHKAMGTRDAAGVAEHLQITIEEAQELLQLAHELAPRMGRT